VLLAGSEQLAGIDADSQRVLGCWHCWHYMMAESAAASGGFDRPYKARHAMEARASDLEARPFWAEICWYCQRMTHHRHCRSSIVSEGLEPGSELLELHIAPAEHGHIDVGHSDGKTL
jgi:hypothetical protein